MMSLKEYDDMLNNTFGYDMSYVKGLPLPVRTTAEYLRKYHKEAYWYGYSVRCKEGDKSC